MRKGFFVVAILGVLTIAAAAQSEVVKVGMVVSGTPPRAYYEPGQKLVGFEPDILNEIGRRSGMQMEYINIEWAGLFAGLQAKKWDIASSAVFIRKDRAAQMDFTDPYMDSDMALMIKKGTPITKFEDMKGKTLGADTGAGGEIWLRENQGKYGPYTIKTYNGVSDAFLDVAAGRIQGAAGDSPTVLFYIKGRPDLDVGFYMNVPYKCAFALRKGDSVELQQRMNKAMKEMKKDGTLAKMFEKWYGRLPERGSATLELFETPYVPDR